MSIREDSILSVYRHAHDSEKYALMKKLMETMENPFSRSSDLFIDCCVNAGKYLSKTKGYKMLAEFIPRECFRFHFSKRQKNDSFLDIIIEGLCKKCNDGFRMYGSISVCEAFITHFDEKKIRISTFDSGCGCYFKYQNGFLRMRFSDFVEKYKDKMAVEYLPG